MSQKEEDRLFSLLVGISASSESTLERLSTSLKVFVKKFFDNKDFSKPIDPLDTVMNIIMKSEAILYTVYELESSNNTDEQKLELLYYKDLVLKSMVVLTNIEFFIDLLKENNLHDDVLELREKIKTEFRLEAAGINKDFEDSDFIDELSSVQKTFSSLKPTIYKIKKKDKTKEKETTDIKLNEISKENTINLLESKEFDKDIAERIAKEYSPLEELTKIIREKYSEKIKKIDKKGNKILRTAMGWEIPTDFFED